jgi:hypothetical protein
MNSEPRFPKIVGSIARRRRLTKEPLLAVLRQSSRLGTVKVPAKKAVQIKSNAQNAFPANQKHVKSLFIYNQGQFLGRNDLICGSFLC